MLYICPWLCSNSFTAETLSEVGRQVLAKHEELISLKVVFLPQVRGPCRPLF